MKLQKIKEAYFENLKFYNELFPVHHVVQKQSWNEYETKELSDMEKMSDIKKVVKETKEILSFSKFLTKKAKELKKRADQSGNPQIWRRGDPLDNLSPGLRERIERGLNFGI